MSTLKAKLFAAKRAANTADRTVEEADREGESWRAIGAKIETNSGGEFIRRTVTYSWEETFGRHTLGELREQAKQLSALSGRQENDLSSERLLFMDTETTGLGVGAGNVPFMIGMAYDTHEGLVIDQSFMRNPAEERPMLMHLKSLMDERDCLITYNGKSFDWPVLQNRFVLNRITYAAANDPLHLDFLHPARSLWKHTLSSCRLSTVEEERLGMGRVEDTPGSLAPTLYFQFLHEKRADIVRGVFEHNEKDLLSLAVLAVHYGKLLTGTFDPDEMGAEELYRLGVWLDRHGSKEKAENVFERLLLRQGPNMPYYWERLAERYKKKQQWDKATELWRKCTVSEQHKRIISAAPFIELAKYYEHRTHHYTKALVYADQAREIVERQLMLARQKDRIRKEKQAIMHRIHRLKEKLSAKSIKDEEAQYEHLYAQFSLFETEETADR